MMLQRQVLVARNPGEGILLSSVRIGQVVALHLGLSFEWWSFREILWREPQCRIVLRFVVVVLLVTEV